MRAGLSSSGAARMAPAPFAQWRGFPLDEEEEEVAYAHARDTGLGARHEAVLELEPALEDTALLVVDREGHMAAFRGKSLGVVAALGHIAHAQAGTRADDELDTVLGEGPRTVEVGEAGELGGVPGIKEDDTIGDGGEVVDEARGYGKALFDGRAVDAPGRVGKLDAPVDHRTRSGDAAAGSLETRQFRAGLAEEAAKGLGERILFLCPVMTVEED